MAQLELDFECRERCEEAERLRREENRRRLGEHLARAGITGLQSAMLVALVNEGRILVQDGLRRVPVRQSERKLAVRCGASKSGAHEALVALQARGLVTRGRGLAVVEWDAVCELPAESETLPPPARTRVLEHKQEIPHQPTIQYQEPRTKNQDANGVPTNDRPKRDRLGRQLRWRELFDCSGGTGWRPLRAGVERLHRDCVEAGWVEAGAEGLAHVLGLVRWLTSTDRREAGVERPIGWLLAALRGGREAVASWPPAEYFETARWMIERAERLEA